MILNGKAKIEFEKWLKENYNELLYSMCGSKTLLKDLLLSDHIKNTDKLLNNAIVDWFDSVGIYILIDYSPKLNEYSGHIIRKLKGSIHTNWLETRQEAAEKAIEKANLIFNSYE